MPEQKFLYSRYTQIWHLVGTESLGGYRYAPLFIDDYSGTVFVYFLKKKSDTVQAT